MSCFKCMRGAHTICEIGDCNGCHSERNVVSLPENNVLSMEETTIETGLERSGKLDSSLKDQQSTGRKRAAKLYPLDRNAPCEWLGVLKAGGGPEPIMGCVNGKQQARHHGPDYNVLNNDPGNVHRVCHRCHNRWHTANDKYKDTNYLSRYGHTVKQEDLSQSAKDLKSGGY